MSFLVDKLPILKKVESRDFPGALKTLNPNMNANLLYKLINTLGPPYYFIQISVVKNILCIK